jgi:ATP synthase protein I
MTEKRPWKQYGRYGTVGLELVLSILVGYYGGGWIDARVHGHGFVTIFGVMVGVYAGFRSLYKAAKFAQRELEQQEALEKKEYEEWLKKQGDPTTSSEDDDADSQKRPTGPSKPDDGRSA